ncbi:MAG: tRNA guanosine(15) transglycosylase TgtA, partial [Nitrososphaera sp.]
LVLCPEGELHPFYSTRSFREIVKKYPDAQVCSYNPFLGIIPAEISDVFPASHNIAVRSHHNLDDYPSFVESLRGFFSNNRFIEIILEGKDGFIESAANAAMLNVRVVSRDDQP